MYINKTNICYTDILYTCIVSLKRLFKCSSYVYIPAFDSINIYGPQKCTSVKIDGTSLNTVT